MRGHIKTSVIVIVILGVMTSAAMAASYSITPSVSEELTVTFWASRRSLSSQNIMEEICSTGNARYTQQRVELEAREAQEAFNAASPEDKAALCAILATYGFTCAE